MKIPRLARPSGAILGVLGLVVGGFLASAAPAIAAAPGTLTVSPATGDDLVVPAFDTSGACDAGTHLIVSVSGSGLSSGANILGNSNANLYISGSTMSVQASETWNDWANANGIGPGSTLHGDLTITVHCLTAPANPATPQDYVGTVVFTPGSTSATYAPPSTTVTTHTSVVVQRPAGTNVTSAAGNQTVTLRATVDQAAAAGSVAFTETRAGGSAVSLGTATVAAGVATKTWAIPVGTLTGSYTIAANFTSTNTAAYSNSSGSTPLSMGQTVTTVTALVLQEPVGVATATAQPGLPLTMRAVVAPYAPGTMVFTATRKGAVPLILARVAVSGSGLAVGTWNVALGQIPTGYTIRAAFVPMWASVAASFRLASVTVTIPYTIATNARGARLAWNPRVVTGTVANVYGYRFLARQVVYVRLYTSATAFRTLAVLRANASGNLGYRVVLPALSSGQHRVVLAATGRAASWWFVR